MNRIIRPPRTRAFTRRLAVGEPLGRRAATLRVWINAGKSDVYAGLRVILDSAKISLHESGRCHAGLTSQFEAANPEAIASLGGNRHQTRWTRATHVGPRFEAPLKFVFPESELATALDAAPEDSDVTWIPAPSANHAVVVSLGFSGHAVADENWPGRGNGVQLLDSVLLPNGEKFWLLWEHYSATPEVANILAEATQHKAASRQVRLSTQPMERTRTLIFKEFLEDRSLIVIESAI